MEDSNKKTSYKDILNAYSNTMNITKFSDLKLYLETELLPYMLSNEESNLEYNSLDLLVDLKDIDTLREKMQTTPFYKDYLDSKYNVKDGNDYGFSFDIDGTNINVNPFRRGGKSHIVFYMDPNGGVHTKEVTSKTPDWLKEYNDISSVSLEYIMKNTKDADAMRLIDRIGYDRNVVEEIKPDKITNKRSIEEVNSVSSNEVMKNSLINFLYKAKMNNNKNISDEKLEEAVEKLHNQSYEEINEHLDKAKNTLDRDKVAKVLKKASPYNNNKFGLTNTKTTSYILIIIGIIICLLAVFIKAI